METVLRWSLDDLKNPTIQKLSGHIYGWALPMRVKAGEIVIFKEKEYKVLDSFTYKNITELKVEPIKQ